MKGQQSLRGNLHHHCRKYCMQLDMAEENKLCMHVSRADTSAYGSMSQY